MLVMGTWMQTRQVHDPQIEHTRTQERTPDTFDDAACGSQVEPPQDTPAYDMSGGSAKGAFDTKQRQSEDTCHPHQPISRKDAPYMTNGDGDPMGVELHSRDVPICQQGGAWHNTLI